MTMLAVILCAETSVAHFPVGGIPLATRHIKELYKRGVRVFYLYGLATLPTAMQQARLPDDAVLHIVAPDTGNLPQQLQHLLHASDEVLLVRGDCLIDP